MSTNIYDYFEAGVKQPAKDQTQKCEMFLYRCKYCVEHKIKRWEVGILAGTSQNSNLHVHLNKADHVSVKAEFETVIL